MRALTILDMRIPVLWTNFFSMGVDRLGLEMNLCAKPFRISSLETEKAHHALLKIRRVPRTPPPGVLPGFCLEPLQILTDKNDHQPARILL